jgi:mannose-1-phosphate guanylyltransferase
MNLVGKPWVVVLAGGSGERLRSVTAAASGRSIPKQFCRLGGRNSMLGITLTRAQGLTAANRILVIVRDKQRFLWESELADVPSENVLVQSQNRGTALALLRALLHVDGRDRDPNACLIVLPSDHLVDDELTLREVIRDAVDEARRSTGHVVLIGAPAGTPDPSLAWIIPGTRGKGRTRLVEGLVEKPSPAMAAKYARRGAFRNTLMLVGGMGALL